MQGLQKYIFPESYLGSFVHLFRFSLNYFLSANLRVGGAATGAFATGAFKPDGFQTRGGAALF